MTCARSDLLTAAQWDAAAIISGDLAEADASPEAVELAAAAADAVTRDVMDDIVAGINAGYTPSGKSGPRVSDAGACGRQVWYREFPPADYTPIPSRYLRHAALGVLIHKAAESVRSVRYPWRRYEFEIPIPGLDRPGRVDEYDPIAGRVTDNKTAGAWKWDHVGDDGPPADAWDQGYVYGYALDAMGLPVRDIEIIFISRENGAEEHFVRPYDPAVGAAALGRLVDLATLLDMGVRPDRAASSPNVYPCKMCPAVDHCWSRPAAAAAGRSPASYTLLGPDPDDSSITWAALEVVRLTKAAAAAAEALKIAKELVQGVPDGEYSGQVTVYTKWSTGIAYKEAFEVAADLAALAASGVPVGEIPEPKRTRSRTTAVKLVRAAVRSKGAAP